MMLVNGAANRDPRHFDCPAEVQIDRPNARDQLAFSRGAHSAWASRWLGPNPGSPSNGCWTGWTTSASPKPITAQPTDAGWEYLPTWLFRGLTELHLTFSTSEASARRT